jgi:diguanylate cyclase (GGDEF)-like protein
MGSEEHDNSEFLKRLAEDHGVAIVALDEASSEISASNNNSICRTLYFSAEFAPKCAEDCGKAFERAFAGGGPVDYECHAGLTCRAVPVREGGRNLVAITGRAFLKTEQYRQATERAVAGDWSKFAAADFFENILIAGSFERIESAAAALAEFAPPPAAAGDDLLEIGRAAEPPIEAKTEAIRRKQEEPERTAAVARTPSAVGPTRKPDLKREVAEAAAWRSLFGSLMDRDYIEACEIVVAFLCDKYGFESLVWLEQKNGSFSSVAAAGSLAGRNIHVNIKADSERLMEAANQQVPVVLQQRQGEAPGEPARKLLLHPVRVGNEIRGAIGIEAPPDDRSLYPHVAKFARAVGPQIEILRLRHEVSSRDWLTHGVRKFNESLRRMDKDDFWMQVTRASAELLRAERVSLLIREEATGRLSAKAAIGSSVDLKATENVGERVASQALERGQTIVVPDVTRSVLGAAPNEWRYKTSSYISYPIVIGDRRLGVMNFTDRADGLAFNERDLELLNTIAPQIAVAIDRGSLQIRAGELEKRSITDSLTGLMNRGYIEERLIEEMNRASRHQFPMSLLMLDVDEFKSYNDSYGHPAGDVALRLVANVLKDTLRAADVAARYGGEEFAVLLPQTAIEEATAIAERIRHRIERTEFPRRRVTVSIGAASFSSEFLEPRDWITAADMALYEAKEQGRNKVRLYEDLGRSFREKIH